MEILLQFLNKVFHLISVNRSELILSQCFHYSKHSLGFSLEIE